MTDTALNKTIFLNAPRAKVWAYLTEPEHLAEWFHKPKKTLQAGEPLEMFGVTSGDKLIWGDVRAAREPEYLEYTFTVGPMGDAVSVVKWWLTEVPGGTQLVLEHTGLPQGAEAFGLTLALDAGWDNHFLTLRTAVVEEA